MTLHVLTDSGEVHREECRLCEGTGTRPGFAPRMFASERCPLCVEGLVRPERCECERCLAERERDGVAVTP